ncbi:MAG: hypothetical protein ACR2QO_15310 [Acidimicrobiales bacterium]
MAVTTAEMLTAPGFADVVNLEDGMLAYHPNDCPELNSGTQQAIMYVHTEFERIPL